jgi:chromosome segregation ATPase
MTCEEKLFAAEQKAFEFESQLGLKTAESDQYKADWEAAVTMNAEWEANYTELSGKFAEAEALIAQYKADIEAYEAQIAAMTAEKEAMDEAYAEAQATIAENKEKYEEDLAKCESDW